MSGILKFVKIKTASAIISSSLGAASSSSQDREPASKFDSSDSELGETESGSPNKKACREKFRPSKSKRKYSKIWEKDFSWLVYDENIDSSFCKVYKQVTAQKIKQYTGGVWVTKPLRNWKKATQKMKAHGKSNLLTTATQALLIASIRGMIVHRMQKYIYAWKVKRKTEML